MNQKLCGTCVHYRQHYTFNSKRIFRVYCGHCMLGRVKHKRPDAKACENHTTGPDQAEAFVSKEYLSKELLQYMLGLELLPKIEEDG